MATHHNLMETMPAWTVAALLVQILEPTSAYLTNLLALHVLLKVRTRFLHLHSQLKC